MKKFVFVFNFLLLFGFSQAADFGLGSELADENERLRAEIALKDQRIGKLERHIVLNMEELARKNHMLKDGTVRYVQLYDYAKSFERDYERLYDYVTRAKETIERFLITQQAKDAEIRRLTEELQAKDQQITNQTAEIQTFRHTNEAHLGMISKHRWNMATTAVFSSLVTYGCVKLFNWLS